MTTDVRHAQLHHVNVFTTRLDEMTDWYGLVLGMEVVFASPLGAWLTNDEANHRVALTALPSLELDRDKRMHARIHHTAFEYASFDDLNATYLRLRDSGIVPRACLDHGMTFSYYYADPDDNYVELQCDVFGDWAASRAWMEESSAFRENPIGAFVDPGRVAAGVRGRGVVRRHPPPRLGDGRLQAGRAPRLRRPAPAPRRPTDAGEVVIRGRRPGPYASIVS